MQLGTLCYVRQAGRTLMLHRIKKDNDFHEGKWNGLGGKVELGESPEECVVREVREESGLAIRNPILHGILTFPSFDEVDDWFVFVYTVHEFGGTLIDSPEGQLQWIEDAVVLDLNLWEGDRTFLPWIDQGRFFSGKFTYSDGKLQSHEVVFHPFQLCGPPVQSGYGRMTPGCEDG